MSYQPKVHIQHPRFRSQTLCGRPFAESRGGEPRSDTTPPAVFNPETGSVNAANCDTCLAMWRKSRDRA